MRRERRGTGGGAGHDESALLEGLVGLGRSGLRHGEIPGRLAHRGKAFAVSELPGTDRASKELRDVLGRARSGCGHRDTRAVRSCASGTGSGVIAGLQILLQIRANLGG
jgi:hypothetical protein